MEPRIYSIIQMLTDDLSRNLRMKEVACSVHLSVSRLRHLFKEETGMSLAQYLKAQRLEKARILLETTHLNLKEVRHQTGLRDRSHFVKDFRRAYGSPPLQYRKQYHQSQQQKNS